MLACCAALFLQFSPSLLSGLTGVKLGPGSGGAGGGPGTSSRSGPPRQRPLQGAKGAKELQGSSQNLQIGTTTTIWRPSLPPPPVLAQRYRSCLQPEPDEFYVEELRHVGVHLLRAVPGQPQVPELRDGDQAKRPLAGGAGAGGRTWLLAGTSGGALALLVLIAISAVVSEPRAHNAPKRTSSMSVALPGRRHPCARGRLLT